MVPSIITKEGSSTLPNAILQDHHGVVWTNNDAFPFSVYPSHYDIPFTPGEASSITASRIDLSNLPPRLSREELENGRAFVERSIRNLPQFSLWEKGLAMGPKEKCLIDMVVLKLSQNRELSFLDLVTMIVTNRQEGEFRRELLLLRFILVTLTSFNVLESTPSQFLSLSSLTSSSRFRIAPLYLVCVEFVSHSCRGRSPGSRTLDHPKAKVRVEPRGTRT